MTTSITLTQEQLAALVAQAVCQAMGSKSSESSAAAKKTRAKKSEEPKAPSGGQAVWRAQVDEVYQELKDAYFAENPELKDLDDKTIRKMVKEGKAPTMPVYGDAMKEASHRRGQEDPETAKKTAARRAKTDKDLAERRAAKAAEKSSQTSESKPKKSSKSEPKTEVITAEDPDEYNKILVHEGVKYAMNGKNHVATIPESEDEEPEWVGIWDPVKKTIVECDQPDE